MCSVTTPSTQECLESCFTGCLTSCLQYANTGVKTSKNLKHFKGGVFDFCFISTPKGIALIMCIQTSFAKHSSHLQSLFFLVGRDDVGRGPK